MNYPTAELFSHTYLGDPIISVYFCVQLFSPMHSQLLRCKSHVYTYFSNDTAILNLYVIIDYILLIIGGKWRLVIKGSLIQLDKKRTVAWEESQDISDKNWHLYLYQLSERMKGCFIERVQILITHVVH